MEEEKITKTIEEWATKKGYLPKDRLVEARLGQRKTQVARSNPDYVKYTTAKAHRKWPVGKEVTEDEFDKAVEDAAGVSAR